MDTHGMKFVVDTSQVAKGLRDYRSAVEGIFTSLDKFEDHVQKTMAGVAKAAGNKQNLNKFRKSLNAFSDVKIDGRAANKIDKLSDALRKFKAPSAAQTKNATAFFKAMGSMPDLTAAYNSARKVKSLSAALDGFKAPSAAQAKRLKEFGKAIQTAAPGFKALGSLRGISGIANELASISIAMRNLKAPSKAQSQNIGLLATALGRLNRAKGGDIAHLTKTLTAVSGFKAPTGAQIKNLSNFVDAIGKMRTPRNADELASALVRIARAANSASQSTRKLRGGLRGTSRGMRQVSRDAAKARVNMMGLQNSFSATFQIGSALRSLFGALTVAELARNFLKASNTALRFRAQMAAISTDAGFAGNQLDWVNETAQRLGLDMLTAEQGFGRLSIAAYKSGLSVAQSRDIFTGFGTAMTVLGTTTERQNDVLLALQQVMNKGYLAAEELNQQLNEHLPGAMAIAADYAKSLGVTLEEGLKKKMLDAEGVLGHMAQTFRTEFGPALEESLKRPEVAFTKLINRFNLFMQKVGEYGANDAIGELLNEITKGMDPQTIEEYAKSVGHSLANAIDSVREAVVWLKENWDSLKGPISTTLDLLAKWMIISGSLQIAKLITLPIKGAAAAFATLAGSMTTTSAAMSVFSTQSIAQARASLAGLTGSQLAAAKASLALRIAIVRTAVATRAAAASNGILAASKVALAGAAGIASKAMLAFRAAGGPLILLLGAVAYAAYELYDAMGEVNRQLKSAERANEDVTKKLTEHQTALSYLSETKKNALIAQGGLTAAIIQGNDTLGKAQQAANAASRSMILLAIQTRKARREMLELALADVTKQMAGLSRNSTSLSLKRAGIEYDRGNYLRAGTALADNVFNYWNNSPDEEAAVNQQFADLSEQRKNLMGRLEIERGMSVDDEIERLKAEQAALAVQGGGVGGDSPSSGGSSGGGQSAADKLKRAQERMRRDAERLAGSFGDVDPLGDLQRNFRNSLAEMGQTLLGNTAYKDFITRLGVETERGIYSVDSLIDTLRGGQGLSSDVIKELADAHGISVERLIDLLEAKQVEFERSIKDSIRKQAEFANADSLGLMEAFSGIVPEIEAMQTALSTLDPIARQVLSNNDYAKFLDQMMSGAEDGAFAVRDMGDALIEFAGGNAAFAAMLETMGIDAEQLAAGMDRVAGSIRKAQDEAKRDNTFGAGLLQDMDNEIALLSVRAEQRDMLSALMDEMDRYTGTISPEMIKQLQGEIAARQQVADALQRQNDFYENNGVRGYINSIKQAGEAAQELDRNVFQSLEDQLYSLGTTGEFSFKAIFDTIQQGLVRFAAQDLTKRFAEGLFSSDEIDGGNPTIFGQLLGGAMGHEYKPADAPRGMNRMLPMFVEITNMGALGIDQQGNAVFGPQSEVLVGDTQGSGGLFRPGAANDNTTVENATADIAQATAGNFGDAMTSMMPLIGMAFASSFKSPIAQIASMFAMMILPKLLGAGGGGAGGGGGLGGLLGGLFGGFKEGGIAGSPVTFHRAPASAFANAPHYAEGTANTSGGIPAILHDNEAVIPLSRGRKVPVEMNDNGRGQTINNNWHITTPDADSFKKSRQQTVTDMHMMAQRSYARNRG